jgi:hypothetical protein
MPRWRQSTVVGQEQKSFGVESRRPTEIAAQGFGSAEKTVGRPLGVAGRGDQSCGL